MERFNLTQLAGDVYIEENHMDGGVILTTKHGNGPSIYLLESTITALLAYLVDRACALPPAKVKTQWPDPPAGLR